MSQPNPPVPDLEDEFACLQQGVQRFGTALDAMDRGGPVKELEAEGHELIRGAFARAPRLNQLLPKLAAKLWAGVSVADDGFKIQAEIEAARQLLRAEANPACYCLADSETPYPWSYNKYESLASRTDPNNSAVSYATIRCKQCGRCYEVQDDSTPATHSICRWRPAPDSAKAS